jgi:hypothetical protein
MYTYSNVVLVIRLACWWSESDAIGGKLGAVERIELLMPDYTVKDVTVLSLFSTLGSLESTRSIKSLATDTRQTQATQPMPSTP